MMAHSWLFFLALLLFFLCVQGFYSMMEMASLSFNRVRLHYFATSRRFLRARWLHTLLKHPPQLFGATLIGVNAALQLGSECARRFYISIGWSPDWAPLSQLFLVLIFAELVPMFAARRYAESIAVFGVPVIYITSLVLFPVIWTLEGICRVVHRLFGVGDLREFYLTREELQKAIEESNDPIGGDGSFDPVLSNIFTLKEKRARDLMDLLKKEELIELGSKVGEVRQLIGLQARPFVPVYHHNRQNIVAIVYLRDLLRLSEETPIRPHCHSPWFIAETQTILEVERAFREYNQTLAVVLNGEGMATGILTFDAIVDELFGEGHISIALRKHVSGEKNVAIDRSFPGQTLVSDLNKWFQIDLIASTREETLEDFMARRLGHDPERGESVVRGDCILTVKESSLLAGKVISVRSIS